MKKAVTCLLILALCLSLSGCINVTIGGSGDSESDTEYTVGGGTAPESVEKIEAVWINGRVEVRYADVSEISFSEKAGEDLTEDDTMHYRINGDTLKISYAKPKIMETINFDDLSKTLIITVPRDKVLYELSIEAVSADTVIDGAAMIDEVDIDTVSGNITADLTRGAEEVSIDTVSGNAELYLPEKGFEAEFDTVSGEMKCDYNVKVSDNVYSYGDAGCSCSIDTVSGNVRILKAK